MMSSVTLGTPSAKAAGITLQTARMRSNKPLSVRSAPEFAAHVYTDQLLPPKDGAQQVLWLQSHKSEVCRAAMAAAIV